MVLSKERTSSEDFSQLGPKRTGAGQGGTLKAVSDSAGTPRAGSTGLGTQRGNLPGSRALRPVFPRAFRTHRAGFSKEGPSFFKTKNPGAGSFKVGAPGDGSSTVEAPGDGSSTVGAPGAGYSSVRAPGDGSSTVEAPGAGSSTYGAPGEDPSVVGDPIIAGSPIRGVLSSASYTETFPSCDVSFPSESLIPQLDGSDPSPKSNLIFHGSNKSTTESNLAPSSSSYSMFGYCTFDKCNLCSKRTRAKVGDFYACFVSKDSSTKGCDLVHAHSRTNLCLIESENIYKCKMWL